MTSRSSAADSVCLNDVALTALRRHTAALHQRVEAASPVRIAMPRLEDYARHITAFRRWLLASSPQTPARIANALPALPRVAWIEHDLASLGTVGDSLVPDDMAGAGASAEGARIWGWLYVQEGSRLGGALLFRAFHEHFPQYDFRFLQGDGSVPARRWADFLALLRKHVTTPLAVEQACAGAVDAFETLLIEFRRVSP